MPFFRQSSSPAPGELARAGVYVHFPWCLAKCPYCDFVSYVGDGAHSSRYADAVIRELAVRARRFEGRLVESVFFGGGTPSLWDPGEIGRVICAVRGLLSAGSSFEVTVECNPTSLDEDKTRALAAAGVNRLSIGVQSLRDPRLKFLGRRHDANGAIAAVRGAMRAGMRRVSADLIFGCDGQSPSEACAEANELVDLGVHHLSCYQLTIEAGTRFGELARRGRLPLAEDGAVADAFVAIDEAMAARGLGHYEISNYARPGEEARHNLAYWRGDEYLGLGCAAYGFVRDRERRGAARGARWRNVVSPEGYMEATRVAECAAARPAGHDDALTALAESTEVLDAETLLRERIMLGLRVRDGIDVGAAARELGVEGWTRARERAAAVLERRGRLVRDGSTVRIPRSAWIFADDTSARML